MSTQPLASSDTLGTMSTYSSQSTGTTRPVERKGDSLGFTATPIQGNSAPGSNSGSNPGTVTIDAALFSQMMGLMVSNQAQPQVPSTITLSDGSKYAGQVQNGLPHGQGALTYPQGNPQNRLTYKGEFQNGLPNGQGTITYKGGETFVGFVENGKTKDGRRNNSDRTYYVGTFKDGSYWTGHYHYENVNGWYKVGYQDGRNRGVYNPATNTYASELTCCDYCVIM